MTSTHRITTSIIVALGLAITAAPASALPVNVNANGSYVPALSGSEQARMHAAELNRSVSPSPPVVRMTTGNTGFDWGDAGIGAASGFALSMIGLGGALAVSQHRIRRTPTPQS